MRLVELVLSGHKLRTATEQLEMVGSTIEPTRQLLTSKPLLVRFWCVGSIGRKQIACCTTYYLARHADFSKSLAQTRECISLCSKQYFVL